MLRTTAVRVQLLVLAAIAAWPGSLRGQPVPPGAAHDRPTCAVLTEATAPAAAEALAARSALLEARLAEGRLVTPVERADFDRLLKEQQLSAAFGPEGGGRRVALGRLLKAELLVFLRPAATKADLTQADPANPAVPAIEGPSDGAVEVVVSETTTGLRLFASPLPLSADAEADARSIAEVVGSVLGKYRQRIRAIYAVPPFLSQDLGYRFDYLKSAYAKVIEQALLDQPGLLVVELAEAHAIGRELAVAGRDKLARPVPLYVLGEYRHAAEVKGGDEAEPRVNVTIRVKRGEAVLASEGVDDLAPEGAAAFLRDALGRLLAEAGAAPAPAGRAPPGGDEDARQLVGRADAFSRLGNTAEEAALREAALLLAPEDDENRRRAVMAWGRLVRGKLTVTTETTPDDIARGAAIYFHGLEHLERFLARAGDLAAYTVPGEIDFISGFRLSAGFASNGYPSAEALAAQAEVQQRNFDVFLRILRRRAAAGWGDDRLFAEAALTGWYEPERRLPKTLELIEALQDLPGAAERTVVIATNMYHVGILDSPPGEAMLAKLAASDRPALRAAAARLRRDVGDARAEKALADAARHPVLKELAGGGQPPAFALNRVRFTIQGEPPPPPDGPAPGGPFHKPFVAGVIPAGDGVDFAWHAEAYVMKRKGVLRPVWSPDGPNDRIAGRPCFDGRYVWAAVSRHQKPPHLAVVDPASERSWEIGLAEGLPVRPQEELPNPYVDQPLRVAPLGPGRACVAGSFGRGWVALVEFDGATGAATVKPFHEAKQVPNAKSETQWERADVAFAPTWMFTLTDRPTGPNQPGESGAAQRVVIGRGGGERGTVGMIGHPLVVDPERLTVEVLRDECVWSQEEPEHMTCDGGALYWASPEGFDPATRTLTTVVRRLGFPGPAVSVAHAKVHHEGNVLAYRTKVVFGPDGRVHAVARRWHVADALDRPFRPLHGGLPRKAGTEQLLDLSRAEIPEGALDVEPINAVFRSHHYGFLARGNGLGGPYPFYEIVFRE